MEAIPGRKRFWGYCLLLGLILPSLPYSALAQSQITELGLDDAVRLALEYNLNLRKTRIDLAASGYSERNLWAEIFPTINASASIGYASALFSGNGFELNDGGLEIRSSLGITLGLNAGIPYAMRSIILAHQGDILKYEDARSQLSIQITKIFYALVAEKNNLLLLEEVLNLAQRQYTRSEVSFRNGLANELSLMQSRLAVENARYNLSAANIAYSNNMAAFLAMLGMETDTRINLLGEINIVRINANAEELIRRHLPLRPDVIRAVQEIERLEYAYMQFVMQSRAPSLSLSLTWNASSFDPLADRLSGTASLNIPIDPWIPGTSRDQAARRSQDAVERARLDLAITQDAARTQIRSLSALLHNSWDSISIARLGLETAQRSYQLTEQGFLNGTVESLVLEDARNNMANARQRLLQSELSYFNMILDLSSALNIDWINLIQIFGVQSEER
jgi:outer membrane protein TolC